MHADGEASFVLFLYNAVQGVDQTTHPTHMDSFIARTTIFADRAPQLVIQRDDFQPLHKVDTYPAGCHDILSNNCVIVGSARMSTYKAVANYGETRGRAYIKKKIKDMPLMAFVGGKQKWDARRPKTNR